MEGLVKDMDKSLASEKEIITTKYKIEDYAITFIYGMGQTQRDRFKQMLEQGYECGKSVAANYKIDYDDFIKEVKKLLKVEV